jgi:hypothetical protein
MVRGLESNLKEQERIRRSVRLTRNGVKDATLIRTIQ